MIRPARVFLVSRSIHVSTLPVVDRCGLASRVSGARFGSSNMLTNVTGYPCGAGERGSCTFENGLGKHWSTQPPCVLSSHRMMRLTTGESRAKHKTKKPQTRDAR